MIPQNDLLLNPLDYIKIVVIIFVNINMVIVVKKSVQYVVLRYL